MIKNLKQAQRVQEKRVNHGKQGYAKAVRRFLISTSPDIMLYLNDRSKLPVLWTTADNQHKGGFRRW